MIKKLGKYDIVSELGRGGMGVVYKGYEADLDRFVAIKMLAQELTDDATVVERFIREAKSVAAISHPNIVPVFVTGSTHEQTYFVMEYIEGESLSEMLARRAPLDSNEVINLLMQTASGLAAAHDKGIIHRDIKPANLMITQQGTLKITDFGIAFVNDMEKRLTNTGEFVGTPGYLSPEVCKGEVVDLRSDIFSLGILVFEMLTGEMPFQEQSPLGMMLEVVEAKIPDVCTLNPNIDPKLSQILNRMVAKERDDRYPSCHELLKDLYALGARQATPPPLAAIPRTAEHQPDIVDSVDISRLEHAANPPQQALQTQFSQSNLSANKRSSPWLGMATAALIIACFGTAGWYGIKAYRSNSFTEEVAINTQRMASITQSDYLLGPDDSTEPNIQEESPSNDGDLGSQALEPVPQKPINSTEKRTLNAIKDNEQPSQLTQASQSKLLAIESVPQHASRSHDESLSLNATQSKALSQPKLQNKIIAKKSPSQQKLVVLAVGDPALAEPMQHTLSQIFRNNGIPILDIDYLGDIEEFVTPNHVNLKRLSHYLQNNGGSVLVLAQVKPLGSKELTYYGEYTTLYSANVTLKAIHLKSRMKLGDDVFEQIDFTLINAQRKAQQTAAPYAKDLVKELKRRKRNQH